MSDRCSPKGGNASPWQAESTFLLLTKEVTLPSEEGSSSSLLFSTNPSEMPLGEERNQLPMEPGNRPGLARLCGPFSTRVVFFPQVPRFA